MKILLDSSTSRSCSEILKAAGHDVERFAELPKDPGDEMITQIAHKSKRVLVTLDKDFGKLAIFLNVPHCGIIRIVDFISGKQGHACLQVLNKYDVDVISNAVITVTPARTRIRHTRSDDT